MARFFENRRRGYCSREQPVHLVRNALDGLAEGSVKRHGLPAPRGSIEDCSLRHGYAEHLFQAHGLSAKLDAVGETSSLVLITFVLYRVGPPESAASGNGDAEFLLSCRQEFDDIGLAGQAKPKRVERNRAPDEDSRSRLNVSRVGLLMQNFSFCGESIFFPDVLYLDKRPAPFAESHVLQAGEWKQVVFGEH